MQPLDLIRHPIVFVSIAFQDFLKWYFLEKPLRIVKTYWEYFAAFNEVFSFGFLLRTLFSPWKQITDKYPARGFNLGQIAQTFTLNVTTRVIGCIFRIVAFIFGMSMHLALLVGFAAFLTAWLLFPGIFMWGMNYLLQSLF